MERKEPSDATTRKRVKQSISIPFVWEEFPGIPKKNWKPTAAQPKKPPPPAPPVKYVASVPFKWEEKPGTPLPSFSQPPPPLPENVVNGFPLSPRGRENIWSCLSDQDGDEIDMQDSYPETCESETDDSFASAAPSLLANGLIPTTAISNAVPVQQISVTGFNSEQLQSPASPASEADSSSSSTSSYETEATSLAGASFLEWLFPLLTPQSNSQAKVMSDSHLQTSKYGKDCEKKYSASITKPQTLGELILMSRRFSYQRKAVQVQTRSLPKGFVKRNELGSCILKTSDILSRFHKKWTRQLQLKLM